MAKRQLGGLISLIGGLDMSPTTEARSFTLAQQQQDIQRRTAAAEQALAQQRLDLDKTRAQDALFLGKEDISLRRDDLTGRREDTAAQRDLSRELLERQQQGSIDLQNLVGAQEVASLRLKGELDQTLQMDLADLQAQRQERLIQAQGENLDKELAQQKVLADREYELAVQRGDDEKAKNILDREYLKIRNVIAKAQETALPGDETHRQKVQKLEERAAELGIEKLARELEETNPESEMGKKLRELRLRGSEASVRQAEAQAEQQEIMTEEGRRRLAERDKKEAAEDEETSTILTEDEEELYDTVTRRVGSRPDGFGAALARGLVPRGNDYGRVIIKTMDAIANETGQTDVSRKATRKLRKLLGLIKDKDINRVLTRQYDMSDDEWGSIKELIEELDTEFNIDVTDFSKGS